MITEKTPRKSYMDAKDFDWHLADKEEINDPHPRQIFASIESCLKAKPCAKHCGIYEVEITMVKIVLEGTDEEFPEGPKI